jgi:hypothetical protein
MPKAIIHPHPTHPYRCADCKFWHPDYKRNFAQNPAMPQQIALIGDLIKQGIPIDTWITFTVSKCFYNPQWVDTKEDEYCSHFAASKVY